MSEPSHSKFNRVLCIVLSVLLFMTVAEIPESFAAAANIEDEAVPMAVSAGSDNGNGAEDGRSSAGEGFLVDAEEASLAAEERSTDIDELGYIPGEVIVVYEDEATDAEKQAVIDVVEGEGSGVEATFESGTTVPVEISDDVTVETAVEMVKQDPAVKYALPNYTVSIWDEPSVVAQGAVAAKLDDRQTRQWYLDYVKAPAAWEAIATNGSTVAPVKVAVIDTGVSLSHSDLANVVDRGQSVEVVHGEEKDLASWTTKPLRGDGYVNGSAAVKILAGV